MVFYNLSRLVLTSAASVACSSDWSQQETVSSVNSAKRRFKSEVSRLIKLYLKCMVDLGSSAFETKKEITDCKEWMKDSSDDKIAARPTIE